MVESRAHLPCHRCGVEPREATAAGKALSWCRDCRLAYNRDRYRDTDKPRARLFRHNYGITLAEYDEILNGQDGACWICLATPEQNGKRLAVDHDHDNNVIRGLLCQSCNIGIGMFKDDPAMMRKAVQYLMQFQNETAAAIT